MPGLLLCSRNREMIMKRLVHATGLWVLIAAMGVSFFSCQKQSSEAGKEGKTPQPASVIGVKYKVGYSCYSLGSPWMESYRKAFEEELQHHPSFDVTWFDGRSDNKAIARNPRKMDFTQG